MNSFDPFREPLEHHVEPDLQSQRDYSERLLQELRQRRRTRASRWLSELVQESIGNSSESCGTEPGCEVDLQARMVTWLERMFDDFDRYVSEFNNGAAGTDLFVSCTRPSWDPSTEQTNTRCQGHLATRFWCLYFQVQCETMEIYILPADMLLAFNTGLGERGDYQPFLVIDGRLEDRGFFWNLGNVQIEKSQLPALARELFSDFIRIASGKAPEDAPPPEPGHADQPLVTRPQPETLEHSFDQTIVSPSGGGEHADFSAQTTSPMPPVQGSFAPPPAPVPFSPFAPPCLPVHNERIDHDSSLTMHQPVLSDQFMQSIEAINIAVDSELSRLSSAAGRAAQMSDLLTLARCKRMVLELSHLRELVLNSVSNVRAIAGENGNRNAA